MIELVNGNRGTSLVGGPPQKAPLHERCVTARDVARIPEIHFEETMKKRHIILLVLSFVTLPLARNVKAHGTPRHQLVQEILMAGVEGPGGFFGRQAGTFRSSSPLCGWGLFRIP